MGTSMGNNERRLGRGLGSLLGGSLGGLDATESEALKDSRQHLGPHATQAGTSTASSSTAGSAAESDRAAEGGAQDHASGTAAADRTQGPGRGHNDSISVARIRPNPYQPRKEFDAEGLEELRASIQSHGLLQPIVVRPAADGFELIAGERRWRAARMAGLDVIRAVVRDQVSDRDMLELALVENVQRRSLNPIEKANGYDTMMRELALTQEQVADKVGLKRSSVANHLRLLTLPKIAQDAVSQGRVSMGHARALVGLPNEALVAQLLEQIQKEDLSVRQVEAIVRDSAPGRGTAEPIGTPGHPSEAAMDLVPQAPWIADLEERLRLSLGTRVQIRNGREYRGQIVIDYYGREDLDRLVPLLAPEQQL